MVRALKATMAKKSKPKKKVSKVSTAKTARKRAKAPARRNSINDRALKAAKAREEKHLKAVGLYEKALGSLQRQNFSRAAAQFEKLVNDFPEEVDLNERSQRYLQVCGRQQREVVAPKTVEERIYAATLALNAGNEQGALEQLETAEANAGDREEIQYMLAVVHATSGNKEAAVNYLRQAIELNPDNRFLARHEASFDALQEDEVVQQMLASPSDEPNEDHAD